MSDADSDEKEIPDSYIRSLLRKFLSDEKITPEIIELKREQLQMKREIGFLRKKLKDMNQQR